jgi:hypothetical protein
MDGEKCGAKNNSDTLPNSCKEDERLRENGFYFLPTIFCQKDAKAGEKK